MLETDDPVVKLCRPKLLKCRFGWIKFYEKSNKKYPGFVHLIDIDGKVRAQQVTANGYVSDIKYEFFGYWNDIPNDQKDKAEVTALNKLNGRFKFSLV